jgi:hypothetical protein
MAVAPVETKQERKRKHWRWSAYLTGALFLVLLSFPPADDQDESASYALGYMFGRILIVLGVALALRALYVKLIRRDGRPIWSPWVFAIALPLALVVTVGRLSSES